jgi:hypothetical protein
VKQIASRAPDVPSKLRLNFNGLRGIIYKKIEIFITIGVRTSNSTSVPPDDDL